MAKKKDLIARLMAPGPRCNGDGTYTVGKGPPPTLHAEAAAEIERLRALLAEAGALFRFYEQSHRAKGLGHEAKAERNAEISERIEAALTPNYHR